MRCDQEIDVEIIRRNRQGHDRILQAMILDHIEEAGENYSAGIKRDLQLDIPVAEIQKALEALERAGQLVSDLRDPPFYDGAGGIMQRRYYRKERE